MPRQDQFGTFFPNSHKMVLLNLARVFWSLELRFTCLYQETILYRICSDLTNHFHLSQIYQGQFSDYLRQTILALFSLCKQSPNFIYCVYRFILAMKRIGQANSLALVLPSFPVSIRDIKLLSESLTLIPFLGVVLGLDLDNESGQIQINIPR